MKSNIWAVVCTDKRGVFFGEIDKSDANNRESLEIAKCQMCVYWAKNVRGVVGLAVTGPSVESRVTKPAKAAVLQGITAIFKCSDVAVEAWHAEPWG